MLNKTAFVKLSKYGIIGVLSNAFLYLIFLLLLWVDIAPVLASGLCYVFGVTISYIFNRKWTFQSERSHMKDMISFLSAYGVGLIVTLISMYLLTMWIVPEIAQIIVIGITAVTIYVALHIFKFGDA